MRFSYVLILAIIVFLPACATTQLDLSLDTDLSSESPVAAHDGILGVDEFIDLRPQVTTSDSKKWLGFIPGVFWLNIISEIPDTYTGFSDYRSGSFKVSFAKSVYKKMERDGLFKKTIFLPADKYAYADYRLEGLINRTFLRETGYYYGSGMYAWLTRIIGLPYVSYEIIIDVTLRIRRLDTNEILWTCDLKGNRIDKYNNIYQLNKGREGKHILAYNIAKILEEQMPVVIQSMRTAMKDR
jgi:hypothetical protein